MKKWFYLSGIVLLSAFISACSPDSEASSDNETSMAWIGTTYDSESNTKVWAVITFDGKTTGRYRMRYDENYRVYNMHYTKEGHTYYCHVNGDSFTIDVDGNTATLVQGGMYTDLVWMSLKNFYQEWYDKLAMKVEEYKQACESGDYRYPQMLLDAMKEVQLDMYNVRYWADTIDGIYIEESPWETAEAQPNQNGSQVQEWQDRYDAQEQKVIGLYYDYRNASDRFQQTAIKNKYEGAQSTLRMIRIEAKEYGCILAESEWETRPITS